jgi:glycosyltransferase involved in cell wall biosynthesis
MRICLVYDCLFPHTVGGAERWYRDLALRLAAEGHAVTYLTLRQWDRGEVPDLPGVRVAVAGPRMRLYRGPGQRRVLPPLVFGAGVLAHLLRHGRRYDAVHTASFPYFSLLAAAALRRLHRFALVVDWIELWTREYWRDYLGPVGGRIGWLVQKACIRVRQRAFCLAELTRRRLREEGLRGEITVLRGLYAGAPAPAQPLPAEPLVVAAGRMIPEKRAPAVVAAVARARERLPELRAVIFGDGPERDRVRASIAQHGLQGVVDAPGFVPAEEVHATLARALCLVHPSRREGYGLVVVEAATAGVPSIVVRGPDNAATELVEDGVNGVVAAGAGAGELAGAIVRVADAGPALRTATAAWYARNAAALSLDASLDTVVRAYAAA